MAGAKSGTRREGPNLAVCENLANGRGKTQRRSKSDGRRSRGLALEALAAARTRRVGALAFGHRI